MLPSLRARWRRHTRTDDGYSTETVAVTATLVALGLGALALIGPEVLQWAGSISLG